MLLLYQASGKWFVYASEFTFHYASTLSWRSCLYSASAARIYIPLCFYFIPYHQRRYEQRHRIYIPLCFYFILNLGQEDLNELINLHSTMLLLYLFRQTWASMPRDNLHSTMLLLYPGILADKTGQNFIYIPLCFYFIRRWWPYRSDRSQIYIPLCFYFITRWIR